MKLNKILTVLIILFVPLLSNGQTAAIANEEVDIKELTSEEAARIYTGKTFTWPNGAPVLVVLLPRSNYISREFIFDHLGMTPNQFYESVDISISVRKNNKVIIVGDEMKVINFVIRNDNSIGYTREYVYLNYANEVKRIKIK